MKKEKNRQLGMKRRVGAKKNAAWYASAKQNGRGGICCWATLVNKKVYLKFLKTLTVLSDYKYLDLRRYITAHWKNKESDIITDKMDCVSCKDCIGVQQYVYQMASRRYACTPLVSGIIYHYKGNHEPIYEAIELNFFFIIFIINYILIKS